MEDLEKLKKTFYALEKKEYKIDVEYHKAFNKAQCYRCKIFIEKYEDLPFDKRFFCCKGCKCEKDVIALFEQNLQATKDKLAAQKDYALAIYNIFNEQKPVLFDVNRKKIIKWDEAFSMDTSKMDNYDFNNIIALFDEKQYGDYKLKDK